MKINVLFFGATADVIGSREISVDLDGNQPNAGAALESVVRRHPSLQEHKLLVSVNQEYAGPETLIKDGDELAIFTAVSGG